jgi:hypothetical protein
MSAQIDTSSLAATGKRYVLVNRGGGSGGLGGAQFRPAHHQLMMRGGVGASQRLIVFNQHLSSRPPAPQQFWQQRRVFTAGVAPGATDAPPPVMGQVRPRPTLSGAKFMFQPTAGPIRYVTTRTVYQPRPRVDTLTANSCARTAGFASRTSLPPLQRSMSNDDAGIVAGSNGGGEQAGGKCESDNFSSVDTDDGKQREASGGHSGRRKQMTKKNEHDYDDPLTIDTKIVIDNNRNNRSQPHSRSSTTSKKNEEYRYKFSPNMVMNSNHSLPTSNKSSPARALVPPWSDQKPAIKKSELHCPFDQSAIWR